MKAFEGSPFFSDSFLSHKEYRILHPEAGQVMNTNPDSSRTSADNAPWGFLLVVPSHPQWDVPSLQTDPHDKSHDKLKEKGKDKADTENKHMKEAFPLENLRVKVYYLLLTQSTTLYVAQAALELPQPSGSWDERYVPLYLSPRGSLLV